MDKLKQKKQRRKFKMPTAFTILFFIILFFVILSWILKWSGVEYTNEWDEQFRVIDQNGVIQDELVTIHHSNIETIKAVGIIDVFYSIIQGFIGKAEIIIFILALGGFILITMNTKGLEALTQALTRKLGDRAIWIIPILVTFFSFCGSTYGMAEESLGFYLLIIPLMMTAGFDTFTGLMIVLFGAGTGVLASTVNPFVIAVAAEAGGEGLSQSDGMAFRWIAWIIFTMVPIVFIMLYARKVKKNPSKSVTFSTLEEDKVFFLSETQEEIKFTHRRRATVVIFLLTFVIMVLYMVAWDTIIGGTGAHDVGEWINNNMPYITGLIPGFGEGGLAEVAVFFIITSFIIALINWKGEEMYVNNMVDGARDLLGVCLVIATAAGIGVILEATGIQQLIVSGLKSSVGGLEKTPFIIVSYLLFLPVSFLIPSTSGFAAAIFPLWGGVATSAGAGAGSIAAFSFSSGLLNLFTPTSGVVMGALGIARVDYGKLFKGGWLFFVILFALSILLLGVGSLLPVAVFG